jgi:hypothetical protein
MLKNACETVSRSYQIYNVFHSGNTGAILAKIIRGRFLQGEQDDQQT